MTDEWNVLEVMFHFAVWVYGSLAPVVVIPWQNSFRSHGAASSVLTIVSWPCAAMLPLTGSARLPSGRIVGFWISFCVPSSVSETIATFFGVVVPLRTPSDASKSMRTIARLPTSGSAMANHSLLLSALETRSYLPT